MNIPDYFSEYHRLLDQPQWPTLMKQFKARIVQARDVGGKLMLAGNGASASIASHLATDFAKQGKVRAMAFNDANLITALGNDCSYENWIAQAVEIYADPQDILVLISSSGKSPNVVKAAHEAKARGLYVAAFTGFASDNPLGAAADINFWVESRSYNIVECTHMILLAGTVDLLIGASEYTVGG
jgi:D-sedoheptulose 7-phosphate isomerase